MHGKPNGYGQGLQRRTEVATGGPNHAEGSYKMVPVIDAKALARRTPQAMADLRRGVCDIGFLVLENTAISADLVNSTLSMYRAFFLQSATVKALVDMAHTGSTRGWGAARAEPDYNQRFQPARGPICGVTRCWSYCSPCAQARANLARKYPVVYERQ